jgi:hypothetical protein
MKKKNMIMRKALSIITSIAIVATMSMPVTFAAESRWTGSGTSDSPYQISSQADLEAINTGLSANNDYTNVYFQITDNINLDSSWTGSSGFQPCFAAGNPCIEPTSHLLRKWG